MCHEKRRLGEYSWEGKSCYWSVLVGVQRKEERGRNTRRDNIQLYGWLESLSVTWDTSICVDFIWESRDVDHCWVLQWPIIVKGRRTETALQALNLVWQQAKTSQNWIYMYLKAIDASWGLNPHPANEAKVNELRFYSHVFLRKAQEKEQPRDPHSNFHPKKSPLPRLVQSFADPRITKQNITCLPPVNRY